MCGYCRNCSNGSPALCETHLPGAVSRMTKDGKPVYHSRPTFVEQTIAHVDALCQSSGRHIVGKDMSYQLCSYHRHRCCCQSREGRSRVLQWQCSACGGVGLNAIQGGVLSSAGKIIAIDRVPYKLELAEQMGATHFVNASKEDPVQRIKEITGGGADYAFEVVGFPALARQAIDSVRTTGTAVVVGVQPTDEEISVEGWHLLLDRTLMGAFHGAARARVDFLWILDLYNQGKIKLDELISRLPSIGRTQRSLR